MIDHTPLFLLLGAVASALLALGLVLMKSRSGVLPAVTGLLGIGAALRWLRDPIWSTGLAIQTSGYALYMIALSGAPVSMLAVVMQGGIAIFVVAAALLLHERARPGEWIAIGAIAAAMILLTLSLRGGTAEKPADHIALMLILIAGVLLACLPHLSSRLRFNGMAPALASGIAFGLGSLYAKAITDAYTESAHNALLAVVATPWLYLAIVTNLTGLVLLQNSFHWARGIIAMPLSSACSNLIPIAGGIVAFGEHLPSDLRSAMLRGSAFILTVLASGFLATSE
jgi:hypothetical protein